MIYRSLLFLFFSITLHPVLAQKTIPEKIDQYIQSRLEKSRIPGLAIAVVHRDSVILSKGYGLNGNGKTITSDSLFAIASLSKAFTAAAVLQLVEKGLVELDAPVINYVPSFRLKDERGSLITVRNLLNQTSGLGDKAFPELAFNEEPSDLKSSIDRMHSVMLLNKPGEKFQYHNPNFQILALLVENVSKERFPDYLQNHIFRPLKMDRTFDVIATKDFRANKSFAPGHVFFLGKGISTKEPDWFIEGGAGIASTANDMAKWLSVQMDYGKSDSVKILDSASVKMMQTNQAGFPYAMGWFGNKDGGVYHNGILWTYSSQQMITRDGYGIVILFNAGLNPFVDYYSFLDGVNQILHDEKPDMTDWSLYYTTAIVIVFTIAFAIAVRRLLRTKQWVNRFQARAKWKSYLFLALRLIPLMLFLSIPFLLTAAVGRVLNWPRIFLMFPDIITFIGIIAVVHLIIVIVRMISLQFHKS